MTRQTSQRCSFASRTAIRVGCLAVALAAVCLAQDPKAALAEHLQKAQIHLEKKEYSQVIEELQKAIEIHAALPGAYYQLGLSHWHLQNFPEAEKAFRKELEFKPPDPYSLYYLGRIRLSEGKTEEAIRRFEQTLNVGTVLDVRRRLAGAYLSTNRTDEAIVLLEDSVATRPEQGELHYLLGRAYQRAGRKAEAQHEFELAEKWKNKQQEDIRAMLRCRVLLREKKTGEALALAAQLRKVPDPDVLLTVSIALGQHGLHQEALPILEQVIELQPSYAEAYHNLGRVRVSLEQLPLAVPLLEKAVDLRPEFYEARMLLGTVLVQVGKNEEAIPHLRAAAQIRTRNAKLLAFLGLQYIQQRYYEEGIKTLRQAIEVDPRDANLRFLLIQAHQKNHDFERALEEAQRAASDFPDLARSHFQVGSQLENMGRFPEAQVYLEKALEIDPRLFEARLMLGEVLLKQGQAEASIPQFRKVLAQDASLSHAYAGLGKALIRLKRYEETEQEMGKAIRVNSELASLHLYLSQAYRALGKMDQAKQEAAIFTRLNRKRAEKRDREAEREYSP